MKSKNQYPCGKCTKNVGRCKAILCKSTCGKWFHLKCTSLTIDEFNNIYKSCVRWTCESCKSHDVLIDQDTTEINNVVSQELETQSEIIQTLNEDLKQALEEIRQLKVQKVNLETLVLEKEETIILLERKISELNTIVKKPVWTEIKSKKIETIVSQSSPTMLSTSQHYNKEQKKRPNSGSVNKIKRHDIETRNRYQVLSLVAEEGSIGEGEKEDITNTKNLEDKNKTRKLPAVRVNTGKKRKILICADSHGRDLAWHVNAVQETHEAVGFVRPGGFSKEVLNEKNIIQENLNKHDALVVICGSNDVTDNNADNFIDTLTSSLDSARNTNVVLVDLPVRHDLPQWSCVNKEIVRTNVRLMELSERYHNLTLVKASEADRRLHTRHGQHFNQSGKRWLSHLIAAKLSVQKPGERSQPPPPGTESLSENSPQHSTAHRQ
jgi:hypothetical protein